MIRRISVGDTGRCALAHSLRGEIDEIWYYTLHDWTRCIKKPTTKHLAGHGHNTGWALWNLVPALHRLISLPDNAGQETFSKDDDAGS